MVNVSRGVRLNARTEQAEGATRPTGPKRLDQKVRGQEQVVMRHLSQTERPRCRGGTYPTQVHERNVVSPLPSQREGEP